MYEIIRFYSDSRPNKLIKSDVTLEEAQEHCRDDETSSSTCEENKETCDWFDGYNEL